MCGLLSAVTVPTLVLYRSGDRLVPPALSRTVARGIPGASEVELAGADHLFIAGDHEAMIDEIEEFVTGRPPPGRATGSWRPCCSPTSWHRRSAQPNSATASGANCLGNTNGWSPAS